MTLGPYRRSEGAWDGTDLARRLRLSLETAERVVKVLASEGYSDPGAPADGVGPEKVVAETALLLLAAAATGRDHAGVRDQIDAVAQLLIPYARGERARVGIWLQPMLARDYAFAHTCLARLGYPDQDVDQLLAQSLAAEAARGRERTPYRDLEQEWLRRVWDPVPSGVRRARPGLAADSMLGRPMDALCSSRDDVYAFTHALMYLTSLGSCRPRLPRSRWAILADAEAAVARCLDEEDYDLGGEALLTWPLLRRRWSAPAVFGWLVLTYVEDEAGFLPAPITRIDRYLTLSGEERSRYALATAYHTIYVMGLLCAAALRPGCGPDASIPRSRRHRGGAGPLLELADMDNRRPHWRTVFADLCPADQEFLAPFLLTVSLRRAVARGDLRSLHTALQVAVSHDLTDAPAPRQAAELLRRALLLGSDFPIAAPGVPLAQS